VPNEDIDSYKRAAELATDAAEKWADKAMAYKRMLDDAETWKSLAKMDIDGLREKLAESVLAVGAVEIDRDQWREKGQENARRLMTIQDMLTAAIHRLEGDNEFDGTPESTAAYLLSLIDREPLIEEKRIPRYKVTRIVAEERTLTHAVTDAMNKMATHGWEYMETRWYSESAYLTWVRYDKEEEDG
jgi:hypothetical protein